MGRRGMSKFIDKTLAEIIDYIKYAVFSEKYAILNAFLQKINPELKFISFMSLIIATIFAHSLYVIAIFFILSILLASLSRIPLRFYMSRVLMFVPLFTGVIALPYIFNIFQPYEGTPIVVLYEFHHVIDLPFLRPFSTIEITKEGVYLASIFLARVTTTVSFMMLLVLTTKWSDIMGALGRLHFPRMFVLIMSMAYRYIFLLLDAVTNMLFSRKSRTVGKESSISSWRLNASIIGALFLKSYDMGGDIYLAMLSRGFSGKPLVRYSSKNIDLKSYLFLGLIWLFCITFLGMDRMI